MFVPRQVRAEVVPDANHRESEWMKNDVLARLRAMILGDVAQGSLPAPVRPAESAED